MIMYNRILLLIICCIFFTIAKESIEEQEMKECSFKPKLFKPPKSVVATYKYLPKEGKYKQTYEDMIE